MFFNTQIDVVYTRCFDNNLNSRTALYTASQHKATVCRRRFFAKSNGVTLFSSVMLFIVFYFFTAKNDEASR